MPQREYGGRNTLTFQKLPGYKNLIAWQRGSDLSTLVHRSTAKFGPGYYRLADQMRGAAISVTGNIAEGYCRTSLREYIRFLEIARGSLGELGSYIQDCERWELLKGAELQEIVRLYGDTTYFVDRLLASLYKKLGEEPSDRQFYLKEERAAYNAGETRVADALQGFIGDICTPSDAFISGTPESLRDP